MCERNVLILDITRMGGNRVCIAGVFNQPGKLENVRPVPRFGSIDTEFLERTSVKPFSIVKFRFTGAAPKPPHVEDHIFELNKKDSVRIVGVLAADSRQTILAQISKDSLSKIFGENLINNKFIYENEPGRSLGCLRIERIDDVFTVAFKDEEKLKLRIAFRQGDDKITLPVVDLSLNQQLFASAESNEIEEFRNKLLSEWRRAEEIYLRVGLARPYRAPDATDEDPCEKCFVMVLGIHAFSEPL